MTWQPIETAPKDGTEVLMYCPGDIPAVVCGAYVDDPEIPYWRYSESLVADVVAEANPTHWMPLPPPPEDAP
jgi:Protein of unknown function (DUF551)